MAYATYRRCFLDSPILILTYKFLSLALLCYSIYSAIVSKDHLQQQILSEDSVSFARLEESRDNPPRCSALTNSTGMCVEWSWLEACESSNQHLFVATYVMEKLEENGPSLQTLGETSGNPRTSWKHRKSHSFYVAEPEAWHVVLEHRLSSILGTFSGQELPGFLRHVQGAMEGAREIDHVFQGLPPTSEAYFKTGGATLRDNRMRLSVGDLLGAAHVNLEQLCERCVEGNLTGEAGRLRQRGVELDITLFYSNLWFSWTDARTWIYPSKDITFEVQISARQPLEGVRTIRTVSQSELLEGIPVSTRHRVIRRSHGVRMRFHQRGIIGKVCAPVFISFIIRILTTLGLAWTLTELICDFTPLACSSVGCEVPSWYNFLTSMSESEEKYKRKAAEPSQQDARKKHK